METWAEIRRRVLVEGQSRRSVCQEYDLHWKTLEKILTHTEPPGYRKRPVNHVCVGRVNGMAFSSDGVS